MTHHTRSSIWHKPAMSRKFPYQFHIREPVSGRCLHHSEFKNTHQQVAIGKSCTSPNCKDVKKQRLECMFASAQASRQLRSIHFMECLGYEQAEKGYSNPKSIIDAPVPSDRTVNARDPDGIYIATRPHQKNRIWIRDTRGLGGWFTNITLPFRAR
jgi:hypothetical protein